MCQSFQISERAILQWKCDERKIYIFQSLLETTYDNVVTLGYLNGQQQYQHLCISSLTAEAKQSATVGGWHNLPKELPCRAKYT